MAGIGALFSPSFGSTKANASSPVDKVDGFVVLKQENGSILISERGGPFQPLDLGDTPEAAELQNLFRRLSPDGAAVRVPVDRSIVAEGGVGVSKSPPPKKQGERSTGKR